MYYQSEFYRSASGRSFWRGYWYYKNGNVVSYEKVSDTEYKGIVRSDSSNEYEVTINLKKPRSSKCNCPFAIGSYKVCKHMVALYFAVFPDEVKRFDEEIYEYEQEQERKALERENREKLIRKEVSKWSKESLINYVVNTMLDEELPEDEDGYDYYW